MIILGKESVLGSKSFVEIRRIADELNEFLEKENIKQELINANVLYANSNVIQKIILQKAIDLGFISEKKGLFAEYENKNLRPDYFLPLKNGGIIMEVERGKTLANNMDLLDVWKCHICQDARFLFLFVPYFRPRGKDKSTKVFEKVIVRLQSFFHSNNYINIDAIVIFGY